MEIFNVRGDSPVTSHNVETVAIPYDTAPFESFLKPGEKIRLYGGIEVENRTEEEIHVRVRFELHRGFVLTVSEPSLLTLLEAGVSMHTSYKILKNEDEIAIETTRKRSGLKSLSFLDQKA